MEYIIKDRDPENVFRFFEDICAIPHGSGNEKGIADYIEGFAKSRRLVYTRDRVHNVFIKKAATEGRENEPTILLQAHTDMVCEKNAGTEHDFFTDPLKLYVEDGWLHARGTTLGGDDGIGVAIMLAILDGAVGSHPALECLFTVSEETGMDGVINFDFSQVSARRLINLDAADINTVICGCAGGLRAAMVFDGALSENKKNAVTVKIGGLAGGHSGENINDGRANANKLMGRFLSVLGDPLIVSLNGGGKVNAIPRECVATVALDDVNSVRSLAASFESEIKNELSADDREFFVEVTPAGVPERAFDGEFSHRLINAMITIPDGVLKMSYKIRGLVEYSRNLGVIRTEGDKIEFLFHDRSGINAQLDLSCRELAAAAELSGARVEFGNRYGGWDFAEKSPLREKYCEAFLKVMGKPIRVESIHAGLECGYIIENIPDMDIISVAPNLVAIHSPDEKLDLDSVEDIFKILDQALAKYRAGKGNIKEIIMPNASENNVPALGQMKYSESISYIGNPEAKTRLLILGNSITRHGPAPEIGWNFDWGMAASAEENDYVHLLAKQLADDGKDVYIMVRQAAEWEFHYLEDEALSWFEEEKKFSPDIILFRLGENIHKPVEQPVCFERIGKLIEELHRPGTRVLFTTCFLKYPVVDAAIEQLAQKRGDPCISLGPIGEIPGMPATGLFEHRGIQLHPSDRGMMGIKDAIYLQIEEWTRS